MKTVGVIPARYAATRFPGKPLADICGKPMIWWVYQAATGSRSFSEVRIALDDKRIAAACEQHGMAYTETAPDHPDHISRMHEVSQKIDADMYVCVNGDEPLLTTGTLDRVGDAISASGEFDELNFVCKITDPSQLVDFSKIKMAVGAGGRVVYMSRSPVPYPRGSSAFDYLKYVGIECFRKDALRFFAETPMGPLERAEDIDHLRFIENGRVMRAYRVDAETLSVDTPKDLDRVRAVMAERLATGREPWL